MIWSYYDDNWTEKNNSFELFSFLSASKFDAQTAPSYENL